MEKALVRAFYNLIQTSQVHYAILRSESHASHLRIEFLKEKFLPFATLRFIE